MRAWLVVALVGTGTMVLKAAGPMVLGRRPLRPTAMRMLALVAPALLAALVAVQTFGGDDGLVVDERAAGLAAAAIAVSLRAPMAVTVTVAAAVTALIRLL